MNSFQQSKGTLQSIFKIQYLNPCPTNYWFYRRSTNWRFTKALELSFSLSVPPTKTAIQPKKKKKCFIEVQNLYGKEHRSCSQLNNFFYIVIHLCKQYPKKRVFLALQKTLSCSCYAVRGNHYS